MRFAHLDKRRKEKLAICLKMREKLANKSLSPDSISQASPNPYSSIDVSIKEGKGGAMKS